jgi:glycosyltransferase involved in cell wall biosynthesis
MNTRALTLLFLSIEYPPESPNGIGSYVAETAAALARRGHEVHVLSCIEGQEDRDYRDGEVWIHRRGEVAMRGVRRLVRGDRATARISQAVACWRETRRLSMKFDIIESPDWMAEGLVLALGRAPVVVQLHTPLAVTRRYGARPASRDVRAAAWLERLLVARARAVLSPSRLVADKLARLGWKNARAAHVIRLPINLDAWSAVVPVRETRPVVLFSGRLEHLKAPEVLVEAAALLRNEGVEFEVVFAGRSADVVDGAPYAEWLERRIEELGAPCRLLGQVSRSEVKTLLEEARVVALPSRYENLPYAALEAMAAGRPVVTTDNTGLAEILDASAGVVTHSGDAPALAAGLKSYLIDARVAARAGENARELVERHCSSATVAAERESVYLSVARARVPSAGE